MSPPDVRKLQRNFVPQLAGDVVPVATVEDRDIPGPGGPLPVRIYRPDGAAPFGALVYFHGGGGVIGSLETADAACRALARRTPCVVVSVGYRLAPEHKFPAGFEDCVAALHWTIDHAAEIGVDPARVAVGGDSTGGALAAAVTLDARANATASPCFQLLIYPATDHNFDRRSCREYGNGFLLTLDEMRWYWENYLSSSDDLQSIYACPLRATSLKGLPPALLLLAECDPLHDEGAAYGERLHADGVGVQSIFYNGQIHGFFTMPGVFDRARVAHEDAATALRHAFAVS